MGGSFAIGPDQLIRVLSLVQSAGTGQRGYLLTRREDYLSPYVMALDQLPASTDRLAELLSDNPRQADNIASLRQLVQQKLDELRWTVDQEKLGNQRPRWRS